MKAELTVININGAAEYLKFIAEIVKAIAWPVVVLLLAARFHTAIQNFAAELAKRIKQLTGPGGISADFDMGKAVEELQEDTERAQTNRPGEFEGQQEFIVAGTLQPPQIKSDADMMATVLKHQPLSPREVNAYVMVLVVAAWTSIESELRRVWAPIESWKSSSSPDVITMLSDLVAQNRLAETTAGLISRAYEIRNKVVINDHANMSRSEGLAYYRTARKILRLLQSK
ncbi:hypothetical protein J2X45_003356 [Caulobacter sp. BE264]|uniref:hypothetical protein n=1 Tax=Caulobacter sp. BE264 TaxID=2817724 RepID=UPI00285F9FBD|nr:hypothetical protein [Caulobacter sp. BE264]MDR7232250.1 hypothetical protein [Caulobacter sp. BE264]